MDRLKNVNQRTKDAVNGYIKQCQALLSMDNNSTYYIIPELVIQWILYFYAIGEEFDPSVCRDSFKLTAENTCIESLKNSYKNAYLTNVVSEGVHKWEFKIHNASTYNPITIGIWKAQYTKITDQGLSYECAKGKYYGWDATRNYLTYGDDNGTKPSWGDRNVKTGDIVQVILDLINFELLFDLNGKSQGVAFKNIEQCDYVVAAYIFQKGDSMGLLSYDSQ